MGISFPANLQDLIKFLQPPSLSFVEPLAPPHLSNQVLKYTYLMDTSVKQQLLRDRLASLLELQASLQSSSWAMPVSKNPGLLFKSLVELKQWAATATTKPVDHCPGGLSTALSPEGLITVSNTSPVLTADNSVNSLGLLSMNSTPQRVDGKQKQLQTSTGPPESVNWSPSTYNYISSNNENHDLEGIGIIISNSTQNCIQQQQQIQNPPQKQVGNGIQITPPASAKAVQMVLKSIEKGELFKKSCPLQPHLIELLIVLAEGQSCTKSFEQLLDLGFQPIGSQNQADGQDMQLQACQTQPIRPSRFQLSSQLNQYIRATLDYYCERKPGLFLDTLRSYTQSLAAPSKVQSPPACSWSIRQLTYTPSTLFSAQSLRSFRKFITARKNLMKTLVKFKETAFKLFHQQKQKDSQVDQLFVQFAKLAAQQAKWKQVINGAAIQIGKSIKETGNNSLLNLTHQNASNQMKYQTTESQFRVQQSMPAIGLLSVYPDKELQRVKGSQQNLQPTDQKDNHPNSIVPPEKTKKIKKKKQLKKNEQVKDSNKQLKIETQEQLKAKSKQEEAGEPKDDRKDISNINQKKEATKIIQKNTILRYFLTSSQPNSTLTPQTTKKSISLANSQVNNLSTNNKELNSANNTANQSPFAFGNVKSEQTNVKEEEKTPNRATKFEPFLIGQLFGMSPSNRLAINQLRHRLITKSELQVLQSQKHQSERTQMQDYFSSIYTIQCTIEFVIYPILFPNNQPLTAPDLDLRRPYKEYTDVLYDDSSVEMEQLCADAVSDDAQEEGSEDKDLSNVVNDDSYLSAELSSADQQVNKPKIERAVGKQWFFQREAPNQSFRQMVWLIEDNPPLLVCQEQKLQKVLNEREKLEICCIIHGSFLPKDQLIKAIVASNERVARSEADGMIKQMTLKQRKQRLLKKEIIDYFSELFEDANSLLEKARLVKETENSEQKAEQLSQRDQRLEEAILSYQGDLYIINLVKHLRQLGFKIGKTEIKRFVGLKEGQEWKRIKAGTQKIGRTDNGADVAVLLRQTTDQGGVAIEEEPNHKSQEVAATQVK